jgi:hypothetical protein
MSRKAKSAVCLWGCAMGLAVLILVTAAATANAGLLATDSTYEHGVAHLAPALDWDEPPDGIIDDWPYVADLEYAVYKDSAPSLGLSGPSYAGKYIYAYQLFNLSNGITDDGMPLVSLNVGVYGSQDMVEQVGYVPDSSAVAPLAPYGTWSPGAQSVMWYFGEFLGDGVQPGEHSTIVYFVSPNRPGTDNATVTGVYPDTVGGVLSPTPEPATGVLMIIGAVFFIFVGPVRRRLW